jgi:hypothetical protein
MDGVEQWHLLHLSGGVRQLEGAERLTGDGAILNRYGMRMILKLALHGLHLSLQGLNLPLKGLQLALQNLDAAIQSIDVLAGLLRGYLIRRRDIVELVL